MDKADIGIIGLGVMGVNLALNLSDKGFSLSVYNRTTAGTAQFIATHGPE
ncbi:MAG: NAD(P)-binding domain-containing protein, partial [Azonexus sp.]|nr:NAD(P)-binding domain-containing protein [Azonexus sp.]